MVKFFNAGKKFMIEREDKCTKAKPAKYTGKDQKHVFLDLADLERTPSNESRTSKYQINPSSSLIMYFRYT